MGRLGWGGGAGGIADIVEDTSPQFGGDMDANGFDLTGIGHVGFLAAQDPSAGANDLDDFERGTWSPGLADDTEGDGVSEGQTYGIRAGFYTKIGNRVSINGEMTMTSVGTLTGGQRARVKGIPFTSGSATDNSSGICFVQGSALNIANAGEIPVGRIGENATSIQVQKWTATTGTVDFTVAEISADGHVRFFGHYGV